MKATLRIDPLPTDRPGDRVCVVDCEHGTTTIALINGGTVDVTDAALVALALARHRDEQPHCRCIRHLERRYLNDRSR